MAGIESDDITQGMTKYLLNIPEILDVLGSSDGVPWLFQDHLLVTIEGSSSSALVVERRGGWAAPNLHNTGNFPRMGLDIYVDPLRDESRNVIDRAEARRRANYIHKIVDRYVHLPRAIDMMWGDIRVIASVKLNEFDIAPVPEGDGVLRGTALYGLSVVS